MSIALANHAVRIRSVDPKLGPAVAEAVKQTSKDLDAIHAVLDPLAKKFAQDQTTEYNVDTIAIRTVSSAPALWGVALTVRKTSVASIPCYVKQNDSNFLCDASAGIVPHLLMSAQKVIAGREFTLKKIDNSGNAARFQAQPGETIDGANTLDITVQYTSRTIYSDGFNWWIK